MVSIEDTSTTCTEWHPIRQFLSHAGYDFALIILNQPIKDENLLMDLWSIGIDIDKNNLPSNQRALTFLIAETRVAADGGANQIYDLNKRSLLTREHNSTSAGNYVRLAT